MNSKRKRGHPGKWNNKETKKKLQELVYLYRQEVEIGTIRVSHIVNFSEKMHLQQPKQFPFAYSKDVWSTYGKEFIDYANEIHVFELLDEHFQKRFELPNLVSILEKNYNNKPKLLKQLVSTQSLLHDLVRESSLIKQENKTLKQKNKLFEEQLRKFEDMVLEFAHHRKISKYREKYGLINQIDPKGNTRNKSLMEQLDKLDTIITPTKEPLDNINERNEAIIFLSNKVKSIEN